MQFYELLSLWQNFLYTFSNRMMNAVVWISFLLLFGVSTMNTMGQQFLTEHTIGGDTITSSHSLEEFSFLTGLWQGHGLGGTIEEQWSPPQAGTMIGTFRLIKESKNVFYELMELSEKEGHVFLKVKHFSSEFIGWEEKEKCITFPFIVRQNNVFYFNGLTMEIQDKVLTLYVRMKNKDGLLYEEKFLYKKNNL